MAPRLTAGRGPRPGPPGRDLLYGRNAVIEALRGPRRARHLYVTAAAARQPRVVQALAGAAERHIPVTQLSAGELDQLLPAVNHQGIALEASAFPYRDLAALLEGAAGKPLVALDHVQDPQNLGTLIRTAEASGCAGLLVPERRAAGISPAVVNASAGAVEHLPVALVVNLARALEQAKRAGYWVAALEDAAGAQSLYATSIPEPTLLVVGSEGHGISAPVLHEADAVVSLPTRGRVESLNAAAAGSIALYELLRRRIEAAAAADR